MLKLGFIGAGTVGTALSVRLKSKGYEVVAVASRSQASAEKLAQTVGGCQVFNNGQGVADTAEHKIHTSYKFCLPSDSAHP